MRRLAAAAVAVLLLSPVVGVGQTADVIREVVGRDPDGEFRRGVDHRADGAAARRQFRDAAKMYNSEWSQGRHTPALAANRGRAYFLAGDLPQAVRAFRDGLDVAPWDADLQRGLALCRAAVTYPAEATPAERVRPDPPRSLRHRASPADLLVVAAGFALLTAVGLARRLTVADGWGTPAAAVGVAGLVLVAGVAVAVEREGRWERAYPVVVITTDAVLRTGNGPSYLPRIDPPLPRGAEVRELGRRGGWVQVEVAGGAVGWVPGGAVLGDGVDSGAAALGPPGGG